MEKLYLMTREAQEGTKMYFGLKPLRNSQTHLKHLTHASVTLYLYPLHTLIIIILIIYEDEVRSTPRAHLNIN